MAKRLFEATPPGQPRYLLLWWTWFLSRTAFGWDDPDQKRVVGVTWVSVIEWAGLTRLASMLAPAWMANFTGGHGAKVRVGAAALIVMVVNHFVFLSDERWREFLHYRAQREKAGKARREAALAGVALVLYVGAVALAFYVHKSSQGVA